MDKNKLLDWLNQDEKVLLNLISKAEKEGNSTSYYNGALYSNKQLKKAIEDGLFELDK